MLCEPLYLHITAGEIGSATSMILVVNMLFGTMLAGLAETLALGEKVGLQQEQILEIVSLLPISSRLNSAKGDGLWYFFFTSLFNAHTLNTDRQFGLHFNYDQCTTLCPEKKVPLYFRLQLSHFLVEFYTFYTVGNVNEYCTIMYNLLT